MTDNATPETARLTADVVLIGDRCGDQYVLAIRRGWPPFEGCWALPGGHVDTGETTHDAAHRELTEETGLRAAAIHVVGVYAEPHRDPRGRYVTFAYTARVNGTPKPNAGDDATEARWLRIDSLAAGSLAFDHDQILRDALDICPFAAESIGTAGAT
jgi:8-oxo-dGTP diphosphatase